MIYGIYCIRDNLNCFLSPVCEISDAVAKRNFKYAMNFNDSLKRNSSDYDFYKLGDFDTDSGIIKPLVFPEMLIRGNSVIEVNDE